MWWNRKQEQSKIFDIVKELVVRVADLEGKVINLDQWLKNLRGIVNRKLRVADDEPEENKDLNKTVLLPDHGYQNSNIAKHR